MAELEKPIVILGAARSGTTLIADTVLSRHPDIAYWNEPNFVWRYGHAYRRNDVLVARDATPRITAQIRRRFTDFVRSSGRVRFMEKTPSNCLRMPFVLEILPDARVIHVLRDGRDVAISAAREWSGTRIARTVSGEQLPGGAVGRSAMILRRESSLRRRVFDLRSLLELPAYSARLVGVLRRQLLHPSDLPWGPRVPGLSSIRRSLSLLETCAVQWEWCVRAARSACLCLPPGRLLDIRYEEFVEHPGTHIERLLAFLDLEGGRDLEEAMAGKVVSRKGSIWRQELQPEERRGIDSLVGSTLRELGYQVYPPADAPAPAGGES